MANNQNNEFMITTMYLRELVDLDLNLNSYKGDVQYRAYQIENQINGIHSVCLLDYVEDGIDDWLLFGRAREGQSVLKPEKLSEICTNLTNLVNNREVTIYNTIGFTNQHWVVKRRKIEDNERLKIYFKRLLKENDLYPEPIIITCAKFKEILLTPTYDLFYKPNEDLVIKCAETQNLEEDGENWFNADNMYINNKVINEFMPDATIDEDPHFEEPTNSGNPSLYKFMIGPSLYNTSNQTEKAASMIVARDIIQAKIEFWNKIKRKMLGIDEEKLEGAYFNVNNIWHNQGDRTETSKTWDIIDSIGIVMMRLLPLLFIILFIVIIVMIVKINKNKCECNK